MTIKELEEHLNADPYYRVGTMDLKKMTWEERAEYHDWLLDQYEELHRYDNISTEEAWDLA